MNRVEGLTAHLCSGKQRNYGSGRMEGKVAFLTGCGSGIGKASAILLAKQGAKVFCCDINEEAVQETVKEIWALVGNDMAKAMGCDVSNQKQVENAVNTCLQTFGKRIDACFANAGVIGPLAPFYELDQDEFDFVFDINVKGVFNVFKYVAKVMMQQPDGGSMIATASVAGIRSGAGDMVYSSSKAAVISMCKTMANQLTGTNIRVNAICPGLIETGMTKMVFDMADARGTRGKIGQLNPLLRYGVPDEIASAVLFLASDDSSYVNGQEFAVCGGLTSSLPVANRKKAVQM
uniref:Uncharacterized protein n=1 Tax=Aplanochytrium stocchinoi TaxID=215587 RepID=A0A7S3LIL5_9STRA|mmetsp:Transcript_21778/g.27840  ORF Transcript_21778/g.27840 Transcript_21778/m.27840 type:complete len:291 (+) Transcript_21778:35-907(+)|eukprot:CAMPEP_0204870048 /NCGR_PEP_ID=MMETSP1348-20121228/31364_1 /ASSEMBLY_ACC=CAM_ASM_000700 /TAXON_ID=215587 /ORGANISM="Aplanochytrium stocchinoi, Strain GSBS06" /LENGTH=290 /DNA_ID=CAMNT_0052023657 /DNA_START=23 /DNA_END=895 /DNA_ORIENTATION=-